MISLPYFAFASLTALRTRSELLRFVSVDDLLPGTLTRMLGACSRKKHANMQETKAAAQHLALAAFTVPRTYPWSHIQWLAAELTCLHSPRHSQGRTSKAWESADAATC